MKPLFVTYNKETKKKEQRQNIFRCCERIEEKNEINENCPLLNLQENSSNSTINSSASSTTNSSTESRKISFNLFMTKPQSMVNSTDSNINNNIKIISNFNQFLGKKTKIHFDIIKNKDMKGTNYNNINIINSSNSQSIDGLEINKEKDESDTLEFNQDNNFNNNINNNNTTIKIKIEKSTERNNCLNEGRWSFQEHIKFIEAIIEYGKNWKDVQKYVGTRTTSQVRSHAQKFLLKLKTIKYPKLNYDFSSNNIKSLFDIIDIIKNKSKTAYIINGKKYIINTLISLSESMNCDNIDFKKDYNNNIKNDDMIKRKESDNNKKEDVSLNNNSNYNKEIKFDIINPNNNKDNLKKELENEKEIKFNNIDKSINYNEKKKDENKNIKINNYSENNNIINTKEDIFNNEDFEIQNTINNKNIDFCLIKEELKKEDYEDNFCKEDYKKANFIIDDGIMYLSDNNLFKMNNISLKLKEYLYMDNFELPNYLYNKYFFS